MNSFTGGCLCGSVKYEYSGPPGDGVACHCSHCRRYTGGVASFNLGVEAAKMQWTKKDTLTNFYDTSDVGEGPRRWFCNKCGSPLATTLDYDPAPMFIKAGSIDNFNQVFPDVKVHLFAPDISSAFKQNWNFDGQTLLKGMPGSEQGINCAASEYDSNRADVLWYEIARQRSQKMAKESFTSM